MRIGIIGSGNIGGTAARLFTRAGHEVALSHAGGPESLKGLVAQLGPNARAATVEDAADFGDVVLLAIPWRDRDDLPSEQLAGKIVIDATNPYAPDFSVYDLGDSTSSEEVAKDAPGARLVKAFNTMRATDLATLGRPDRPRDQRPVLFLARLRPDHEGTRGAGGAGRARRRRRQARGNGGQDHARGRADEAGGVLQAGRDGT